MYFQTKDFNIISKKSQFRRKKKYPVWFSFHQNFQGRTDFMDLVKVSNAFNPSSGDLASPSTFTIALPTITPSAPHPATCPSQYILIHSISKLHWTQKQKLVNTKEDRPASRARVSICQSQPQQAWLLPAVPKLKPSKCKVTWIIKIYNCKIRKEIESIKGLLICHLNPKDFCNDFDKCTEHKLDLVTDQGLFKNV